MPRFLIADDHEMVRIGMKQILLDGFPQSDIVETSDGKTLAKKAIEGEWDLVITDFAMPGGSGLDALKEIRKKKPGLPVLVISFHTEEQYAQHALQAGAQGYLNKNAIPDELVRSVKEILTDRI